MLMPYQYKTQHEFPPSQGWIKVENNRNVTIHVVIEPWASEHDLLPGEVCYVHLVPDETEILLRLSDEYLSVFCGDAIYQDAREIIDLRD